MTRRVFKFIGYAMLIVIILVVVTWFIEGVYEHGHDTGNGIPAPTTTEKR